MSLGYSKDSFIYSEISGSVQTQLEKRKQLVKKRTSRTGDDILYLNGNTSWVKLSSGVDELVKNEQGKILPNNTRAQSNVLLGGTYDDKGKKIKKGIFTKNPDESSYTFSERFGFRPMAGITNTSIKTQGTFGAIKKATVEFQVNSLDQLEDFEKIYMLPGYSILLEWGHTITLDNKGKIDTDIKTFNKWFDDLYPNDEKNEQHRSAKILEHLDSLRGRNNYSYDALYGKVSNYVWSFNPDGTYNCSIDITGYGELAESMSALFTPKPTAEEEKNISENAVNRFAMYLSLITDKFPTTSDNRPISDLTTETLNVKKQGMAGGHTELEMLKDNFHNYVILDIQNSKAEQGADIASKYITFGSLLNFINDNFVLRDNNKQLTPFYTGNYDTTKLQYPKYENKTPFVTFNDHISSNLDVCFLPKKPSEEYKFDIFFAKNEIVSDVIKNGDTDDILNILVNAGHIYDSYNKLLKSNKNEDINVYHFVKTLLDEIAKSLGNINKFAIETRDQLLFISDRAGIPGDVSYTLDLFGLGSLATNISLQSSIPSSLSTLIAIGASAGGTSLNENIFNFQSFYKNFVDRLVPQRELDENAKNAESFNVEISDEDRKRLSKSANIVGAYVRALNSKRNVKDQTISHLITSHQTITNLLLKKTLIDNNHNAPGIIPIQLSFEIYGISGLRITDVFNIQEGLLPSRYKNNVSFTITGIDNAIASNRWTTTVSAVMMVTTPLKEIIVSDFEIDDIFESIDQIFPSEILEEGFPNATKVRKYIEALPGDLFREKGLELTSAGMDITKKSADLAIGLMQVIYTEINGISPYTAATFGKNIPNPNKIISSLRFRWTGGNDSFHLYNPKDGNTLHRFGKALDLAIQQNFTPEQAILAKQIVAKASEKVMSRRKHKFVDEYKEPSSHANGPHFHFSVRGGTAQQEAAEREAIEERTTDV